MFSDGTQFKMTARRKRFQLFNSGDNYIQVYNAVRAYKLTPPVLGPEQLTLSDISIIPQL